VPTLSHVCTCAFALEVTRICCTSHLAGICTACTYFTGQLLGRKMLLKSLNSCCGPGSSSCTEAAIAVTVRLYERRLADRHAPAADHWGTAGLACHCTHHDLVVILCKISRALSSCQETRSQDQQRCRGRGPARGGGQGRMVHCSCANCCALMHSSVN